jgi:hypothetical protein
VAENRSSTSSIGTAKRRRHHVRQQRQRHQVGAEAAEAEHGVAQRDGHAHGRQLGQRQVRQAARRASSVCPGATRVNRTGSRDRSSASPRWRDDDVVRRRQVAGVGEVLAEVRAARVLARQRRHRDDAADGDQVLQVDPVVPAHVEGAVGVGHAGARQLRVQLVEPLQAALQRAGRAQDADVVPHAVVQRLAHRLEVARGSANGASARATAAAMAASSARGQRLAPHPVGHHVAGDAAEHGGIGDAVAAQAVGAVHAAGVLAGREQRGQRGAWRRARTTTPPIM